MAYRLALPEELIGIHNVFHVSQLKKYYPALDLVLNDVGANFKGWPDVKRKAKTNCQTHCQGATRKANPNV